MSPHENDVIIGPYEHDDGQIVIKVLGPMATHVQPLINQYLPGTGGVDVSYLSTNKKVIVVKCCPEDGNDSTKKLRERIREECITYIMEHTGLAANDESRPNDNFVTFFEDCSPELQAAFLQPDAQ